VWMIHLTFFTDLREDTDYRLRTAPRTACGEDYYNTSSAPRCVIVLALTRSQEELARSKEREVGEGEGATPV
jgi:hypothetical protein